MTTKSSAETKRYHTNLYKTTELFGKGTWLERPEKIVLDLAKRFENKKNVKVLDIGSGVGRHAIPIAKIIGKNNGKVVCIDFLGAAIKKLNKNAKKYGVEKYIDSYISDVSKFPIRKNEYDMIIAHSALEHVENRKNFENIVKRMMAGTAKGGYNYMFSITNLEEIDISSDKNLNPYIELYLKTKETEELFRRLYKNWKIISLKSVPYKEILHRKGKKVIWKCNYLLLIVKKL